MDVLCEEMPGTTVWSAPQAQGLPAAPAQGAASGGGPADVHGRAYFKNGFFSAVR